MRGCLGVALFSMALLGCSGSSDEPRVSVDGGAEISAAPTAPAAGDPTAPPGDTDGGDNGTAGSASATSTADCAFIMKAQPDTVIGLQLIPQMTNQAAIDSIKSGVLKLDAAGLLAYLEALRPLGGREYEVFGDPADEIEHYIKSTTAARDLLAIDGPVPQETLDAFVSTIGDPREFIMGQTALGAAIAESCQ